MNFEEIKNIFKIALTTMKKIYYFKYIKLQIVVLGGQMNKKTIIAYILLIICYITVLIGYLNDWRYNEDWIVFFTFPIIIISISFFICGVKK